MNKILKYIFVSITIGLLLVGLFVFQEKDNKLHVTFLNVGQGDSILIKAPNGEKILVDGGPDSSVIKKLPNYLAFYDNTIDYVILTHPHPDHVNGLVEVLRRYNVRKVFINGIYYKYPTYDEFLRLVSEKKIQLNITDSSSDFEVGDMKIDFIYPINSIAGKSYINANLSSIVFRIIYKNESFLFMGDLELEGENDLTKEGIDLRSDIIKIGHHGSRTASGRAFIEKVKPTYALISCGMNNSFKHPHAETIDLLQFLKIGILRTDLSGSIEITSDGNDYAIKKEF